MLKKGHEMNREDIEKNLNSSDTAILRVSARNYSHPTIYTVVKVLEFGEDSFTITDKFHRKITLLYSLVEQITTTKKRDDMYGDK